VLTPGRASFLRFCSGVGLIMAGGVGFFIGVGYCLFGCRGFVDDVGVSSSSVCTVSGLFLPSS